MQCPDPSYISLEKNGYWVSGNWQSQTQAHPRQQGYPYQFTFIGVFFGESYQCPNNNPSNNPTYYSFQVNCGYQAVDDSLIILIPQNNNLVNFTQTTGSWTFGNGILTCQKSSITPNACSFYTAQTVNNACNSSNRP